MSPRMAVGSKSGSARTTNGKRRRRAPGDRCRSHPSGAASTSTRSTPMLVDNRGPIMTTSATRLFLVRHGATQLTAEDKFSGSVGVDLSDAGRAQVRALAQRLAGETISAVYCSPLSRTVETAAILAAPHGLPLCHRDGLREISHGR